MRTLKFRAWNSELGKMTYGVPNEDEDEDVDVDDRYYRDGDCFGHVEMVNYELRNTPQFIWEQHTGFKDKNGKEIYEGDVMKMAKRVGKVVWLEKEAGFGFVDLRSTYFCAPLSRVVDVGAVIGNIHENSELLEEEKSRKEKK